MGDVREKGLGPELLGDAGGDDRWAFHKRKSWPQPALHRSKYGADCSSFASMATIGQKRAFDRI